MYIYNSLMYVNIEFGVSDHRQIVRFWIERSKFSRLSFKDP